MTIKSLLFVSNFLNHHQKPLADFFYQTMRGAYHFVSCQPMPEQFKKFGYPDYESEPYNILMYKGEAEKKDVEYWVENSDILVMGGVYNLPIIEHRLKTKKIMFFYSERWHKNIRSYLIQPVRWLNGYTHKRFSRYNNANVYMLCAGAYVPNDCRLEDAYQGKTFKWGYFPATQNFSYETISSMRDKCSCIEILWVARFLDWKHPEIAIKVVHKIIQENYNVHLTMIGGVDKTNKKSQAVYESTLKYIKEHSLEKKISIKGNVPNEEVHQIMRNSHIFLFTSDRHEGWGAVLNEAMSEGCACIASNMIGAAPYLIEHKKNGLIAKNKSVNSFTQLLKFLLDNKKLMEQIGKSAYISMREMWDPETAAKRLLELSSSLIENHPSPFTSGPCSIAEPI